MKKGLTYKEIISLKVEVRIDDRLNFLKKTMNYPDDVVFMCIFLKDLKLDDENKKSFSDSHFIVGARWLDDLIKINKNQGI